MKRLILLFAILFQLTACTSTLKQPSNQARLDETTWIQLPEPSLQQPLIRHQLLSVETSERRQSFQALLKADTAGLELVALTPSGIGLFSLLYNQQGITTEQKVSHQALPPAAQVLADIMLAYWPLESWQTRLPRGWSLQSTASARKLVTAKGEALVTIDLHQEKNRSEPYRLTHHGFGYKLHIKNLD